MTQPALVRDGLFPFPVMGDNMEPRLCRGDIALVASVSRYIGEGIYVLDGPLGAGLYRAEVKSGTVPQIRLWSDNARYPDHVVPPDWFHENVRAKVVFAMNVLDRRLVPDGMMV